MSKKGFIHSTSYYELNINHASYVQPPMDCFHMLNIQVRLKHENKDPSETHMHVRCPSFVNGFYISSLHNIVADLDEWWVHLKGSFASYLVRFEALHSQQNYPHRLLEMDQICLK